MDNVNHPDYYGGENNTYEAIKVIDAWGLGFCLGNVVKYISRAGKKEGNSMIQDLKKASFYLDHEINKLQGQEPIKVPILTSEENAKKTQSKEKSQ